MPKDVFGEGPLLQLFYNVMEDLAPGAWALNNYFLSIWDEKALDYAWKLPDNFHVRTKVLGTKEEGFVFAGTPFVLKRSVNMPTETGRSLGANVTHSIDGYLVREIVRRCKYDPLVISNVRFALASPTPESVEMDSNAEMVAILWDHYKKTNMLSARIFDYIDCNSVGLIDNKDAVWKLIADLPRKPFDVITVHDCFRVLPNYGNDIRQQYNNLLAELADSELLSVIVSAIRGKPVKLNKLDKDMAKDIRVADYTLS